MLLEQLFNFHTFPGGFVYSPSKQGGGNGARGNSGWRLPTAARTFCPQMPRRVSALFCPPRPGKIPNRTDSEVSNGQTRSAVGEARRKREAVLNGPCPCRSVRPARLCCFNGRDWHKPPAVLGLKALSPASRVEKYYMKELGSCVAPISGEHLISQSVIRVLMADGDFSVSGLPWLEEGEEKLLPPHTFTTNCLCVKHNSALHPLDAAAKYFFESLKSC